MKKYLLITLLTTFLIGAFSLLGNVTHAQESPRKYPQGIAFPHSLLDAALHNNVDDQGNLNYLKLQGNKDLGYYMEAIASADLERFPTFTEDAIDPKTGKKTGTVTDHSAELVFWINAYNASIISAIAKEYPIKSIDEIKNFDTEETHLIAGEKYSFAKLREKIGKLDPRALFALISGTKGGFLPVKTAFRYSYLNSNLDAVVRHFINNPNNVEINRIQNVVRANENLKEIDTPFNIEKSRRKWGGVRYALAAYTDKGLNQRYLTNTEYRLDFAKADRKLNDFTSSGVGN